jgi:hypothetical protein
MNFGLFYSLLNYYKYNQKAKFSTKRKVKSLKYKTSEETGIKIFVR